jgi:GNAT superfamily N-acetyltransferase
VGEHYRQVVLNITIDEFHRLPRNAAYKYEYFDGRAVLTPRPKTFTCILDLSGAPLPDPPYPVNVRHLPKPEWPELSDLFSAAVHSTQPFYSLDKNAAKAAAADCYAKATTGEDGPVIEAACFRADDPHERGPVGGAIVTLVPDAVLTEPFAGLWKEPPPANAIEQRLGCPHLTWVFVHPWMGRRGIGTALLAAVVPAIRDLGYQYLASTFLLDNGPSTLWHWRNGFRLLPQMSALTERWKRKHPDS